MKSVTIVLLLLAVLLTGAGVACMRHLRMPGRSFTGTPPPLSEKQIAARARMQEDVAYLAARGARTLFRPGSMERAATYVLKRFGGGSVDEAGNVVFVLEGETNGVVVVGAHYDSVEGSPGADDNASGVAVLIELARRLGHAEARGKTIWLVAFANEEPPHFRTTRMGSWQLAKRCQENGVNVTAMLSIESVGYFSDEQSYPALLGLVFPPRGDFLAFVGDTRSRALVRQAIHAFRRRTTVASEGAALPTAIDVAGWSDQWSFWQRGYPAIMVTDTALFRNPHYHTPGDLPETLDYDQLARVADGLEDVVRELASAPSAPSA